MSETDTLHSVARYSEYEKCVLTLSETAKLKGGVKPEKEKGQQDPRNSWWQPLSNSEIHCNGM